jgi:predicted transcriptional regulator of viral defense system
MYRIDVLLKQEQKLFHTQDLALLWGIENKNTLYTTIKRYIKKGILIPIHKGYYSTVPINTIDPSRLGLGYLHTYGYISIETVLVQQGILFQSASSITLISSISKSFTIGGNTYISRKITDTFLHNNAGIISQGGVYVATVERAVADTLYLRPRFHFDNERAIDWKKVKELQTFIGYI